MSPGPSEREIYHTEISYWLYIAVVNIRILTTGAYVISVLQKKCLPQELCYLNEGKLELPGYGLFFICLSNPVMSKPHRSCLRLARVVQHTQNEGQFHLVNVGLSQAGESCPTYSERRTISFGKCRTVSGWRELSNILRTKDNFIW